MLRFLTPFLLVSLVGYWYATVAVVCPVPLTYALGPLDERFNLTAAEAEKAVTDAVAVWEAASGRDLFVPVTGEADVLVSFLFDDRQERALAEESLRESLENKEANSTTVGQTYEELVREYKASQSEHQAAIERYEAKLEAHNAIVAEYNESGGAPEEVYAELRATERALAAEAMALDGTSKELATLAEQINAVGEEGNAIIAQYNEGVEAYNEEFGEPAEFTQGDYQDGHIHIYTFSSRAELVNVLVHEFGHALDIPHVEGSESMMYYLMEDQPTPPRLSETDAAAFMASCGADTGIATWFRTLINQYL